MKSKRSRRLSGLAQLWEGESGQIGFTSLIAFSIVMMMLASTLSLLSTKTLLVSISARRRMALDLCHGGVEQMIGALIDNGFDPSLVAPVNETAPDGRWVSTATAQLQVDQTVKIAAMASVLGAVKRLEVVIQPGYGLTPNGVLEGPSTVNRSGGTATSVMLDGNVYCGTTNLTSANFTSTSWRSYTGTPATSIPTVPSQVFLDAANLLTGVQTMPATTISANATWSNNRRVTGNLTVNNSRVLTIAAGAWCVVDGNLVLNGTIVVNGTLYVKGTLNGGRVAGTGIVAVVSTLNTQTDTSRSWNGLRVFGFSSVTWQARAGSVNTGGFFIYSPTSVSLSVRGAVTMDPGLIVSRGAIALTAQNTSTVLTIRNGSFTWNGLNIPVYFGAQGFTVSSWQEFDGS